MLPIDSNTSGPSVSGREMATRVPAEQEEDRRGAEAHGAPAPDKHCKVAGCRCERMRGITVCHDHEIAWDRKFTLAEWTAMSNADRTVAWRAFVAEEASHVAPR